MEFHTDHTGADELLERSIHDYHVAVDHAEEVRATAVTYDQIAQLIDARGGSVNIEGDTYVTPKTALQVATVLACARAIANGCATPNLNVFREKPDGTREKATNIPEFRLLARRPNEWQTSFEWRRMMTLHAVMSGAALSIKVRGLNGRVRELIPVAPGSWTERQISRYEVEYECSDQWGLIGRFKREDVFILRNLQWEMYETMNCVQVAKSSITLAMSTDRSINSQMYNGLQPSGVYTVDGKLNPEQHTKLEKWVNERIGPKNRGKPLILDNGAKWTSTAGKNTDGQTAELRAQTIEEICRVMGVFPIIVGHSDKAATFASTEAFFGAHLKQDLTPWHRNWTQNYDEMLLDGAGPLFAEFDTRYLTAGSMKDRSEYIRAVIDTGTQNRNEVRDDLGLDPVAGLDKHLMPLNMTTTGDKNAAQTDET
ncbi:MAG: phage portal protein [Pseudomonadota bacterium]